MSRVAKRPVALPQGVTTTVDGSTVTVKGAKGALKLPLRPGLSLVQEGQNVRVEPATMSASRPSFAFSTLSTPPSCTTFACSAFTARLSVPLPPLMVTLSAAIVAVTPCGRVTGCLATRDIVALSYDTMQSTSPP